MFGRRRAFAAVSELVLRNQAVPILDRSTAASAPAEFSSYTTVPTARKQQVLAQSQSNSPHLLWQLGEQRQCRSLFSFSESCSKKYQERKLIR